MPGGQVFGASDRQAAYPAQDKVTQADIAATIYHLLGLEAETRVHDKLNRPWPIALGEPINKLLGGGMPAGCDEASDTRNDESSRSVRSNGCCGSGVIGI